VLDAHDRSLLELRFAEAGEDVGKLKALEAVLSQRREHWARVLRLRTIERLRSARESPDQQATSQLGAAAAKYGLPAPDGRWLYQYGLSEPSFVTLAEEVRKLAVSGMLEKSPVAAGLFVLWASEWFRRCHPGGILKWADVENAISCEHAQHVWRDITARGLRGWRRPVIRGAGVRYFLSTLAREGGFPTAAIRNENRGWATAVLADLVAGLLHEENPDEERALEFARMQRGKLPAAFSDDDFLVLCADLALAIARLRQVAEPVARASGIPISAWLDANDPGWRERLPLRTDAPSAAALMDTLLVVKPKPLGAASLRAQRLLIRTATGWSEALKFSLSGEIDQASARSLDSSGGQLRLFAAGSLARFIPGLLAIADPPSEPGSPWNCTATDLATRILEAPFLSPVELEPRSERTSQGRIRMQGGSPVTSDLTVFTASANDEEDEPRELMLRCVGSCSLRAEEIFVRAPSGWTVEPVEADERVSSLGPAGSDLILWRVYRGAIIKTPGHDQFRVVGGQSADRSDLIDLIGDQLGVILAVDPAVPIFRGSPIVRLSRNGATASGQTFMRRCGESRWDPVEFPLLSGCFEIAWREHGIIRDSRRLAVVPEKASVTVRRLQHGPRYDLRGWTGCSLMPRADAPVFASSDGSFWTARSGTGPRRQFQAEIAWEMPARATFPVWVPFPCDAGISRWDGKVLRPGSHVALADISNLSAFADGPMIMYGSLRDDRGLKVPGGEIRWAFDTEMPLASIGEDLATLLNFGGADAKVELGMHDSIENYWYVGQFDTYLRMEAGAFVASNGIADLDVNLCGRAMRRPFDEREFSPYSLIDETNHRPIALPQELSGSWMIYLRSGDRVLSRPIITNFPDRETEASDSYAEALEAGARGDLVPLREILNNVEPDDSALHIALQLIEVACSLRGLPPDCLPVFKLLPQFPLLLATMALIATDEQRDCVLGLSESLPFEWYLIDAPTWKFAEEACFSRSLQQLSREGLEASGPRYALQMLAASKLDLLGKRPILTTALGGSCEGNLRTITQSFLNRAVDAVPPTSGSIFRVRIGQNLPSYFLDLPDHCLETLDAPCAAAAAAIGAWQPDATEIWRMKVIARSFPIYFEQAYGVWLKKLRGDGD
jgi:hypothetical protein